MATVTMLKKDAIINLKVGTGFVQKIQQVLSGLTSERTEEELDQFKTLVEKGETEFDEDWMDHVYTLSAFIRIIEMEAINQGATYEQDVDAINKAES